jgi:hypothetical protein
LKIDLTEGSETSAKLNQKPGKYPKEIIKVQVYQMGKNSWSVVRVMQCVKEIVVCNWNNWIYTV